MADTMQCDLVSPERLVASVQATAVRIPGKEGDLTAMPNHVPMITTLRPGILAIDSAQGSDEYVVTGGFVEINGSHVSVLAEESLHRDEMSQEILDRMMREAAERQRKTEETFDNQPGPADDAAKLLSDMMAMGTHIGLSPNQSNL